VIKISTKITDATMFLVSSMPKYLFWSGAVLFLWLAILFSPQNALAASLYLSPATGSYAIGDAFSVVVRLDTSGQSANAAEGVISFPKDKLRVTSVSSGSSVFNLWTQEPTFSNSAGTLTFGGGLPHPGYTGSAGSIFTIRFSVLSSGGAAVGFVSGAVLANDGKGTNILSSMDGGNYTLNPKTTIPGVTPPPTTITGMPAAPEVSSATHPDSTKWYSNNTAVFTWPVGKDITAVRLLVDEVPGSVPAVLYSPPINQKTLEDMDDGRWYFHSRLRNNSGWSNITHFAFNIDTVPPSPFDVLIDNGGDYTNPSPVLYFQTEDSLSGIDKYEMKIADGEWFKVKFVEPGKFVLPQQTPGKRTIIVSAFDRAGNKTSETIDLEIRPIDSPVFTDWPKSLTTKDILIIKGETYPNAQVFIDFSKDGSPIETRKAVSDGNGRFTVIYDKKLERGVYAINATTQDIRGAISLKSDDLTIPVRLPAFLQIGEKAFSFIASILIIILVIAIILFILTWLWHRYNMWMRKLRKEVKEAEGVTTKAFKLLKDDLQKHLKAIEHAKTKRDLSLEEKKLVKELKENLNIAEKSLQKEIHDIEEELR